MSRILVAGIGNIFLGDDAFGCEVIRALSRRALPEEVSVKDFGIRAFDLASAIGEYPNLILVDAIARGDAPGTVSLVEIDTEELAGGEPVLPNGHEMTPLRVLQLARSLGTVHGKILLIGCEPENLENESGEFRLSRSVQAAISQAVDLVDSLVRRMLEKEKTIGAGVVPA